MSRASRVIGHFRVLLASDLAVRVLIFGTGIVVARVLGPRQFGLVTVALAIVSYAAVLGDGGLTTLSQLTLMRTGTQDDRLVSATLLLQVGLAATAALLLSLVMWLLPFQHDERLLTLTAMPVLLAQALSALYVLQAQERMAAVAALRLLAQLTTTGLCLGLLALGWRGSAVTTSQWAGLLVADAVAGVIILRGALWRPGRPDRTFLIGYARQAWPYLLALLSVQVIINADVVVLGASRSGAETGEYGAAFRLTAACLAFVGVVTSAAFPELVRAARVHGEAAPLVLRLVRLTCRPGFAATALVVLAAAPLTRLVYGGSYTHSHRYLAILFVLVPLGFYNTVLSQALLAAGQQRVWLRAVGTTAVLTVVGLVLTVPVWGPTAAAIVTVVGELTSLVMLTLLVRRPLAVNAVPVLLEQLPFLLVPVACGLAARWLLDATAWEAAAVGAVAVLGCEAMARTRIGPELREILASLTSRTTT